MKNEYLLHIMGTSTLKNIQLRVESDLKDQAESVLTELGFDMPTAIRIFLKKLIRTRAIPFPVSADTSSYLNDFEHEAIRAREETRDPRNRCGPFADADKMIASLRRKK